MHPWECPNVSIQYNAHDKELLLVGKIGNNLELYDDDAPTFHVNRIRIAELVREFKAAHSLKNAEPNVKYNEKPKEIKRLNSITQLMKLLQNHLIGVRSFAVRKSEISHKKLQM